MSKSEQKGQHFVDGYRGGRRFREVTAMLRENVVFLTDEEYGRVLSSVVVACVDTLVIYRGKTTGEASHG